MYQEQINIVHFQILERFINSLGNILWVVLVIPELGSDEQFISWDTTLANGSSNRFFGAVPIRSTVLSASATFRDRGASVRTLSPYQYGDSRP